MKMILVHILLTLSVFTAYTAETAAVFTLRNDGGLTDGEVNIITERVEYTFIKNGIFKMVSRRDLEQILKEQGFQQSGSCNDASCIVEIGKMLAVQKMISGSIGKIGSLYSISLKTYDISSGAVVAQVTKDLGGSKENLLSKGIPALVHELCAEIGGKNQTAPEAIKNGKKANLPLVIGGAAVGIAAVGIVIYLVLPKGSPEGETGSVVVIPEITTPPPSRGVERQQ